MHLDRSPKALLQATVPFVIGYFFLGSFVKAAIVGAITYGIKRRSRRSSDPYGTFHLKLNLRPGENPSEPPATEWLNMGYWKDTNVFPDACRALALKVATAAQLDQIQDAHVLDVGYGSGESLLMLLRDKAVNRPARLAGITNLPAHYQRSRKRVEEALRDIPDPHPEVYLRPGDAVFRSSDRDSLDEYDEHPLDPTSKAREYDAVLALDCAYHFNTREEFLKQAYKRLVPGGRVALADIYFGPNARTTWTVRATLAALSMPVANAVTFEEYRNMMQRVGYVDVEMEDVSDHVYPGFASFLRTQGVGWWIFAAVIAAMARSGTRYLIVSGAKARTRSP